MRKEVKISREFIPFTREKFTKTLDRFKKQLWSFNLETAIGGEKAVRAIYMHRKFLKFVVTLLVMRDF